MALDINEKEKGALPRLVLKAHKAAGNQFFGGIADNTMSTKSLEHEEYLMMGFYFPVDSVIWDAGFQVYAGVNRDNNDWDCVAGGSCLPGQEGLVRGPRNAEGHVQAGMQFFSPRDKLYGSLDAADTKGTTPFKPNTLAKKDNKGDDIDWVINDGAADEIPLHSSPGWLNKAARMQLAYGVVSTSGGARTFNVNFTRKIRGRSKGFKVEAGTMLVYWVYNATGTTDENMSIRLGVECVPRINFFPLDDIVQNLKYNNRSDARWGSNHEVEMTTIAGHGVNRLFTRAIKVVGDQG